MRGKGYTFYLTDVVPPILMQHSGFFSRKTPKSRRSRQKRDGIRETGHASGIGAAPDRHPRGDTKRPGTLASPIAPGRPVPHKICHAFVPARRHFHHTDFGDVTGSSHRTILLERSGMLTLGHALARFFFCESPHFWRLLLKQIPPFSHPPPRNGTFFARFAKISLDSCSEPFIVRHGLSFLRIEFSF